MTVEKKLSEAQKLYDYLKGQMHGVMPAVEEIQTAVLHPDNILAHEESAYRDGRYQYGYVNVVTLLAEAERLSSEVASLSAALETIQSLCNMELGDWAGVDAVHLPSNLLHYAQLHDIATEALNGVNPS